MLGWFLLLMADGGTTAAATTADAITRPSWTRLLTQEEFANYYPVGAARLGVAGRAVIKCSATADGHLADCVLLEESPPGKEFGAAALKMATIMRMSPTDKDGKPVAGRSIRLPLEFKVEDRPIDDLTVTLRCYGRAAVEADRNPKSETAWSAARVWASQAIAMSFQSGAKLMSLEESLHQAHAMAATSDAHAKPTLAECLAAVSKAAAGAQPPTRTP